MMTTPHPSRDGDLFATLPGNDEEAERRLRARLAAAASEAGILDVAYRTIDTPVGVLLLAATDTGLVRVAYASENHDQVLDQLANKVSPRVLRAPARLEMAAREIEEYFAGRRTVLTRLPGIAYGRTASYAAMAAAAGNPNAVRAAGTACATNPLPVVVPCHRVIRSDGTLGQYVGGFDVKKTLLTLEGAA